MTDDRFFALKEELRSYAPFVYVQTTEVHQWASFLKGIASKVNPDSWTFMSDASLEATEAAQVIEQKMSEHEKRKARRRFSSFPTSGFRTNCVTS